MAIWYEGVVVHVAKISGKIFIHRRSHIKFRKLYFLARCEMDSILTSVKKMLGISEDMTHFDPDIIMHINTCLMVLNQMGIGEMGFVITDETARWDDFVSNIEQLSGIKSYVYLRVKQLFDPNASQALNESINNIIKELEWRLYITENPKDTFEEGADI